ncbi:polyphenol oxidase family protein [Arthrobacter sp. Br18]|uniref:polyphenol oxidase family protein n=1 Tax=Arthrobacter sp. Br18 TaxID=1312954 RepID=UPI0031B82565
MAFTSAAAGNLALSVGGDPEAALHSRRALEASLGVLPGSLRFMNQTHSSVVADVGPAAAAPADAAPATVAPAADAMVSADGSVPLAVLVADCVPVVLADRRGRATAVVHAGRQGTLDGIAGRTVLRLRQQGVTEIDAWIGPSVCGECYEVPASMRDEVSAVVPSARATTRHGTPSLDLRAAVAGQLDELGVDVLSRDCALSESSCTLENRRLFSHRREPGAGRFAGLVWRA